MNDVVRTVISIIKHVPGLHDQKTHGGDLREALYSPLDKIGTKPVESDLHGFWNQINMNRPPASRKEILDFASNQLLPEQWQKRYQTLYSDMLSLGKDNETAAFDAGKKVLGEFETTYGSEAREDSASKGWETRRYSETAGKYDAGRGTPHQHYVETLKRLENARMSVAHSNIADKLNNMNKVDALVAEVKVLEKTKTNRHPDYGQFTWKADAVPLEHQKTGFLHFESPSQSFVDVLESTGKTTEADLVYAESPFGQVRYKGPKAVEKMAKFLLNTYGIPSDKWVKGSKTRV